jgi:GNAT superfamily N-acetyltransferase
MTALRDRTATAADYDTVVRLIPELGSGDPIPERERWEAEMLPFTLFLERGDEVVAYAYVTPLRDVAYVRHVVVAPGARGQRVGGALMRAIARRSRSAGCTRWCLNVKPENVPAVRLYASFGMREAYTSTPMRLGWDVLARLPREEREVAARPFEPSEDAALEEAFGLPAGRIASLRGVGAWVFLRLVDPARPEDDRLGVACFNPPFPGSFPFRVARPALAFPLISAIRSHALPEHDYTQVVVEGDPALKQALLEAGAEARYELLQMDGEIPPVD